MNMETAPRIVRNTKLMDKPFVIPGQEACRDDVDSPELDYQQLESLAMETIRQEIEETAFQRGYSQAKNENANDLGALSQKLGELKKEIWVLLSEARRYENR